MDFGYFHEEESEQFAFYRIPQVLFKDERFAKLSTDAKVLYGLFLNRVSLCLAHIIAKSYHFRTVIQLSRYTRENIPQGVTFKTPIFVRFFKTFFKKLKVCSVAQKRPSLGRHFESLKKRLFMKLFYFR